jgi:hypothetical protein
VYSSCRGGHESTTSGMPGCGSAVVNILRSSSTNATTPQPYPLAATAIACHLACSSHRTAAAIIARSVGRWIVSQSASSASGAAYVTPGTLSGIRVCVRLWQLVCRIWDRESIRAYVRTYVRTLVCRRRPGHLWPVRKFVARRQNINGPPLLRRSMPTFARAPT